MMTLNQHPTGSSSNEKTNLDVVEAICNMLDDLSPRFDKKSYKDLIVWQKSISLVKNIYLLTAEFPKNELYGLTSQIRKVYQSIITDRVTHNIFSNPTKIITKYNIIKL